METKELKVQVPEGYEIDKENSTFERIKFKPIKKGIRYRNICYDLFSREPTYAQGGYYIDNGGYVSFGSYYSNDSLCRKSNATNRKQLERILALNQLLNIAEYYNTLHPTCVNHTTIEHDGVNNIYYTSEVSTKYLRGISAIFNNQEDAQAVIDNPNFREILDTIYKD